MSEVEAGSLCGWPVLPAPPGRRCGGRHLIHANHPASLTTCAGQGAPSAARLRRQARLLSMLVRCITGVALVAAAYGPAYAHLALLLLYGRRWAGSEAPAALGAYALHLPLLAANGIMEAFVHAVADARELHAVNAWLVVFTATHAGLSIVAVRAGGASGLIAADAANMALRIAYCAAFARRRFARAVPGFRLRQLLPSGATAAALGAAAVVTSASRVVLLPASSALAAAAAARGISLVPPALAQRLAAQSFAGAAAAHVGVGVACLAVVGAVAARHELSIVSEVRQLRRKATKSA